MDMFCTRKRNKNKYCNDNINIEEENEKSQRPSGLLK